MPENNKNTEVSPLFEKEKKWKPEMEKLREIVLKSGLTEEKKWWQPCYSHHGKNICIIGSFKDFCTLSFFKGALLKDSKKILEFPGPNSQSAKMVKITSVSQVENLQNTLLSYIKEAIENEKSGAKIEFKKITEHQIPEELENFFTQNTAFKKAFESLTPGRQRAYILHFSSAKQSETRTSRIEKSMDRIFEGKGLND